MRVLGVTQHVQSGAPRPAWRLTLGNRELGRRTLGLSTLGLSAVGTVLLVAVGYAAGSLTAYWLIHLSDAGAVFFPAAGVSLAALVLSPRSRWPAIVATVAATEFLIDQAQGHSIGASLGFAAANSFEPLVGAALLVWATGATLDLGQKPGLGYFVLYAVVIGPLVGGLIGAATIALNSDSGMWEMVLPFWAGDAMGVLSVGAAVITARQWRQSFRVSSVALVGSASACVVVFLPAVPVTFLAVLPLFWLAFRGNIAALCAGGVGVTLAANVATAMGRGRWATLDSSATEVATLQLFLAISVLSAWLLAVEIREREVFTLRYQVERHTAIELQRELLPKIPKDLEGVKVGARYRPGDVEHEVGGDWYDAFTPRPGCVALVVGDIVGHDLSAASAMGRTHIAVRLLAQQSQRTPGELLDALDDACHVLPESSYSTVGYAEFIPSSMTLTYACAGHPPPLLVDETGARFLMDGRSTPLAIPQGARCTGETHLSRPGRLVWYSDGLIERRNRSIEEGLERLRCVVGDLSAQLSPDEWCAKILAAMTSGEIIEDDIVVLCASLDGCPDALLVHPRIREREGGRQGQPSGVHDEP